jgi:hypothetical protein
MPPILRAARPGANDAVAQLHESSCTKKAP